VKTLDFLKRHEISPQKVTLYVADAAEQSSYREALSQDDYWGNCNLRIEVGVLGIMSQRNHIVKVLPESAYVVSLDDDISDVLWLRPTGPFAAQPLPSGSFEKIVFNAYRAMTKHRAFIWGLHSTTSTKPRYLSSDGISCRNGIVNGFCYGFINRHSNMLLPRIADATEDVERSLRYFAKDGLVLRYRMYSGKTNCFKNSYGIQSLFCGQSLVVINRARKIQETNAADQLRKLFPNLTKTSKKKKPGCIQSLVLSFKSRGGHVLPVTTIERLRIAKKCDAIRYRQMIRHKIDHEGASSDGS
jgi:hypothetical protein